MKSPVLIILTAMFLSLSGFVYHPNTYAQSERNFVYDSLSEKLSQELKASLKVMNDPDIIKANAKYIRGLYNALIEQGFSKEEALTLVAASLSGRQKP